MDNSHNRLQDIFFYGLYMDDGILHDRGVAARNKRVAVAEGYRLRIGNNSTLLRKTGSRAYGVVCSLRHDEIHRLYAGCGLDQYVPEAVLVKTDGRYIPALCFVLLHPPSDNRIDKPYFQRLAACMKRYGMPIPGKV